MLYGPSGCSLHTQRRRCYHAKETSVPTKTIAIAGGGLAGLTCAKYLVDVGLRVIVLESEPILGGRASTFRDRDGEWIEQGLHLFLGAYSEFRKLLTEIGRPPDDVLFWTDKIHLQDTQGKQATYGTNPLYAPLTTLLSVFTQNDYLGIIDKLSVVPLAAPALASLESIRRLYDGLTVTQWWNRVSAREQVLERVLRPLCRAIQFTDADQFSAYDFLGWAHHSIYDLPNLRLAGYRGARDESIFAPLGRYLTDRGAQIRVNTSILEVSYQPTTRSIGGFVLPGGERVEADAYVAAMPAWVLPSLLPPSLLSQPFFSHIGDLPVAPAISVQLWFDRPIAGTPEFHLVARTPVCVYQEQSPHLSCHPRQSNIGHRFAGG